MASPTVARRRGRFGGRGRTIGVVVVVAVVVLAMSLKGIATFYTDFLWFRSLGLTNVWRQVLGARLVLAAIFIGVFFVLCFVSLTVADRIAPKRRPQGPEEELLVAWHAFYERRARLVRFSVSGVFALIAGAGVSSQWNEWLLFTNGVKFGETDPLYGKDIGFYVFRLPFLTFLVNWLFFAFVMVLLITAIQHYLNGGIRLQVERDYVTPQVKAHLSLLLAVLALVKAADYWLQRYELVFSTRGVVDGATYTDVKVQRPAIYLLLSISLLSVALLVTNIKRRGWQLPAVTVGLWAFCAVVVGGLYPAFVQRFQVEPAQSTKEQIYVERNIAATRAAYGLDDVEQRDFAYQAEPTTEELLDNVDNLENARMLTPRRSESTFTALQAGKDFYTFGIPDLDRYVIDGVPQQVIIGVRELNQDDSQSWENAHLAFTHGDGVVIAPANAIDANLPEFLVSGLPPEIDPSLELTIDRSQVYFGENLSGYSIIDTSRDEVGINSRTGETTVSNFSDSANGETAGVEMGSFVRRAAFALRFSRIDPLISNFVSSESRIIYKRDVRSRVMAVAPFLKFDSDPYPVVIDGRTVYVIDGYTTTNRYPYSQKVSGLSSNNDLGGSNYVRNSVKGVVDGFNGSVTLYAMPERDPLLEAYSKAFPGLFTPFAEMPAELQQHLRYPTDLFEVQTVMWGRYHVDDPTVLLENSQRWDVANDPGDEPQANTSTSDSTTAAATVSTNDAMKPHYAQTKLPGEDKPSFVIMQSFSPTSAGNRTPVLTGIMVGKSDLDEYGKLVVYNVGGANPRAPSGVQNRIASSEQVSEAITLLNSRGQGSKVFYGDMMTVPVANSLIYVRSLYVQPEDDRTAATIEKVIVSVGDRVAMADTFGEALDALFPGVDLGSMVDGGTGSTSGDGDGVVVDGGSGTNGDPDPGDGEVITGTDAEKVVQILVLVQNKRAEANRLFGNGDFAGYAKLQSEIDDLLADAAALLGPAPTTTIAGQSSPTTTTSSSASESGATGLGTSSLEGSSGERSSTAPSSGTTTGTATTTPTGTRPVSSAPTATSVVKPPPVTTTMRMTQALTTAAR